MVWPCAFLPFLSGRAMIFHCWWCVRAAEGASLEMMFGVKANGGSNPSTTALVKARRAELGGFSVCGVVWLACECICECG